MASLVQRPDRPTWYLQYYVSGKLKRKSTGTDSFQIAREQQRQFESAQARGDLLPLPTKSAIADVVTAYVGHVRTIKTPKSAQTDVYYLRDVFGPICEALKVNSRKVSQKAKKRPPKPGQDRRCKAPVIEANTFEQITTADITAFIRGRVASRGLAPKTANRYREILTRLFNWSTSQFGIRMPRECNPARAVERYREHAPEIRFLTLEQIQRQLGALAKDVKMQAMVATLIYAGLRREELLWLTPGDIEWDRGNYGLIRIQAKTVGFESWQPKTKRNRVVPISSLLRPYLDHWRYKHKNGPWFFPNSRGGRWDPDNFSSDLRAFNSAQGLGWEDQSKNKAAKPPKSSDKKLKIPFGCLDYRHTFGSQLAMKGESLYKIAQLMGNSPEIVRRHYAALLTESLVDSVEFGVLPLAVGA
jgi:integrase